MKILVTGGTGLVGQELVPALLKAGHEPVVLSRDSEKVRRLFGSQVQAVEGDLLKAPLSKDDLTGLEAVVHLLGESVGGGLWTKARKERILQSRQWSARNLWLSLPFQSLKQVISASAVGYYGDRGDEILTEESSSGQGFLPEVCRQWESALFDPPAATGEGLSPAEKTAFDLVEKTAFRIGLVLSAKGGALEKMRPAYQWQLGGPLGSGQQWMSWIHLEDLVRLILWRLERKLQPSMVFNAVAPQPVRNEDFSKSYNAVLHGKRRAGLRVPAFVLKTALGEMSDLLLESQRVEPRQAVASGFEFHFPDLDSALRQTK